MEKSSKHVKDLSVLLSVFIPACLRDEIVFGDTYPLGKEGVDFSSEQENERGDVLEQQENYDECHLSNSATLEECRIEREEKQEQLHRYRSHERPTPAIAHVTTKRAKRDMPVRNHRIDDFERDH